MPSPGGPGGEPWGATKKRYFRFDPHETAAGLVLHVEVEILTGDHEILCGVLGDPAGWRKAGQRFAFRDAPRAETGKLRICRRGIFLDLTTPNVVASGKMSKGFRYALLSPRRIPSSRRGSRSPSSPCCAPSRR